MSDPGEIKEYIGSSMPVIIISGLRRSGSSVFWETFRKDPRLCCYDEPFNPNLKELPDQNSKGTRDVIALYKASPDVFLDRFSPIQLSEETEPNLNAKQDVFLRWLLPQSQQREVFPGIPDFICHFHFLRDIDIGKDFLEPAYSSLRSCLRKHKTSPRLHALAQEIKQRLSGQDSAPELLAKAFLSGELPENTNLLPLASAYSMILWMLQGKHSGDGYGFPFDRPLLVFAERLLEGQQHLPELLACCHDTDKTGKQSVIKLARIVSDIINDTRFQQRVQELHWRCQVFDSLRKAMRIALPDGRNGLNDDGTDEAISTICASVQRFRSKLDNNAKWSADKLCCKMAKQIDKWSEKLFADPIEVDTPRGTVIIYPQRTNNILEQFSRGIRRGQRRKTGNNSIRRMLQTMLADTPLVKNLDNDEYMKILLDGKANLEELFADLELTATARSADLSVGIDRLLPGFRRLITQQTLPVQVAQLLSKNEIMAESN